MQFTPLFCSKTQQFSANQALSITNPPTHRPPPIALFGHGEGGLVAMHAAALEPRISATILSGYFQGHQPLFATEPLYRNVQNYLTKFDDAGKSTNNLPLLVMHRSSLTVCLWYRDELADLTESDRGARGGPGGERSAAAATR